MKYELVGSARSDSDSRQLQTARLLNMYRENNGGKFTLKSVLGTEAFATVSGVLMRRMIFAGDRIYALHGGRLSSILSDGTSTDLRSIPSDPNTDVATNAGALTIVADGDYYLYQDGEISQPDTGRFQDVGSVCFSNQKAVITQKNGREIAWSDLLAPDTFQADNFATAEQNDENIIRAVPINGQIVVFKEESTEFWYDQGVSLAYRPGSLVDIGLLAFPLYCDTVNGGFFIGSDKVAYLTAGGQPRPVSSRSVETAIAEETPENCFYYEDEGHKFCVVQFAGRPAWVFDISSNEWHERCEGRNLGPWSAVEAVKAFGNYYVGTKTGSIHKLTRNNADVSGPLIRRVISGNIRTDGEYFAVNSLEIQCVTGFVDITGFTNTALQHNSAAFAVEGEDDFALLAERGVLKPTDAGVLLRLSKDRGVTFGRSRRRSVGMLGDYSQQVRWRGLGTYRNVCFDISISDPAEVTLEAVADIALS